jgi:hypothetical protein
MVSGKLLKAVEGSCYLCREWNSCIQSVVTPVCNAFFLGYPAVRYRCDTWFLILGVSEKKILKKSQDF